MIKTISLIGFNASGKDTLLKQILSIHKDFHKIINHTTRPKRENEIDGIDYFFITKDEFINAINNKEFIEYRTYNTLLNNVPDVWYYGVKKDSIKEEKINIIASDIKSYLKFKELYGDDSVGIYLHCEPEERRRRAKLRGDYDEFEFNRRLLDDENIYNSGLIEKNVDYIIESGNLMQNLLEFEYILNELMKNK